MAPKRRLCVIGAGASGLPSIRHGLLYDLDVVCFEATNEVGGLWNFTKEVTESSCVMKTTVINTSKEMTAYSDYPPEPKMANFMHNREMHRYFKSYAKEFDLYKYIKFNHKVKTVVRAKDYKNSGNWDVTYFDDTGAEHKETYDGVLLCCGHHAEPNMPKPWPGQESFKGEIIHSHSYRDHIGYEDKRVAVVGIGNSGGDIAVELSKIAKQVYLVTRRGSWILNRVGTHGRPFDIELNTRWFQWFRDTVPLPIINKIAAWNLNRRFDHALFDLEPQHGVFAAHPTVNDELPNRIASGTVRVKPNIARFIGDNTIEFVDGTRADDIDAVLLSTGYHFDFPLLEGGKLVPVVDNKCDVYQYMYPLETADHNSLAIVGLIQPIGSIMPISEMQARVFLENRFGRKRIPSKSEMMESIRMKKDLMAARYVNSPRHTIQVDYVSYMDELAELAGCKPPIKELFKSDPKLAMKLIFGPCTSYEYRLSGPHPWSGARQAIMTVEERVHMATCSKPYHESNTVVYMLATIVFAIILFFFVL